MNISNEIFKSCEKDGYTLRLATKAEINNILQLYIERTAWFKENGIDQWQKYLEHHNKDEFLKAVDCQELFVIYKNDFLIACFEISEESRLWDEKTNDSYYIYKIVTKINSKGLGNLIFKICNDIAKENNKKYLKIDCLNRNTKLNELYNLHGFEFIRTDTKDYYTFNLRRRAVK